VSTRLANWIGIALLAFSVFSIPALFSPPDSDYALMEAAEWTARNDAKGSAPTASAIRQYYDGFMTLRRHLWLESVLFFCASVLAALVTFWRKTLGVWLVLLVCAYLLYVTGPSFIRMSLDGGLIHFMSLVFTTTMRQHGVSSGLVISWHLVVAPFAYALLALVGIYSLWQGQRSRPRESN
jgi:hypothetical protein